MFTTDPSNKFMLITAGDYKVHPAANIVPLDTFFEPLESSIERSGLIDPITLYKGEIIDGRRRAITCKKLDIPVREDEISTVMGELSEKEVYEFVLAKNNRRSLSKAQLAMIAAVEVSKNSHKLIGIPNATLYAKEIWGVSKVTYEKARYILNNSRDIAEGIFSNGFAVINNNQYSMAKAYNYIKQNPEGNSTLDAETLSIFSKSIDALIDANSNSLHTNEMAKILNNKVRHLLGK